MSKKILIAEDSIVIQNIMKQVLSRFNFQIKPVKNGQKVLETLEKEDFDLILLDINMPVMDGIECAKNIRESEKQYQAIPIIAITGNANDFTKEDFITAGINTFLPKPINYDSLIEKVKEYTSDN